MTGFVAAAGFQVEAMLVMGLLGLLFGVGLAVAARKFAVQRDPRIEMVSEALPGANCGACGYAGCAAYAEAVVLGAAPPNLCAIGADKATAAIAGIMGVEAVKQDPKVAVLMCQGGTKVSDMFRYDGVADCRAARLIAGGPKECTYGCLGLATCVVACPVDAIVMGDEGLPVVLEDRCVGCGECRRACPRSLFMILPRGKHVHDACSSHDPGGRARKICPRACIACRKCEKTCRFDAVHVVDNLAVFDYDKCVVCRECVPGCPTGAIIDLTETRKALYETASAAVGV